MSDLSLNFIIMKLRNMRFNPQYHNDGWSKKIFIDNIGNKSTENARIFIKKYYPEIDVVVR